MHQHVSVLTLASACALTACISEPSAPSLPTEPPASGSSGPATPSQTSSGAKAEKAAADATKPTTDLLPEAVYVLMTGSKDGDHYFCTGTLVSKDRVVTAAHCLDGAIFKDYQVVAPLAPGAPRVKASKPMPIARDVDTNPASPDIGLLSLDQPITLPTYAVLTDVSERVEGGEALTATALVRTEVEQEAPLHALDPLALKSTADLGYEHGFGVPLFSHGGDSGAGLFLVENGRATHKLVGVARQPDPDNRMDQVTRIDAVVLAWFHGAAGM